MSYKMKWKELTSEMEQATMQGDQSGYSGFMKKAMTIFDPELAKNSLRGENANTYDPKHDQNKVYGPVDSITTSTPKAFQGSSLGSLAADMHLILRPFIIRISASFFEASLLSIAIS